MFKILEKSGKRLYDLGKKPRTLALVECLNCGDVTEMLLQNAMKCNRAGKQHCQKCKYHRLTGTRIWRIWMGLRWRAQDTLDKNYGGRGINVCPEWKNFTTFYADMSPGYSDDLTIERIDVNQSYSKDNCRWATNMEQQANKRNNRLVVYQGEQIHLAELCRRTGVSKMKMLLRLNKGMTGDEAVTDATLSPYGKSQNPIHVHRREKRMSMIS